VLLSDKCHLSGHEDNFVSLLARSIDKVVSFDCGCTIWLINDDGVFWGSDPYGNDWCCQADEDCIISIKNWVMYWSENRDETGSLIT
jgi:hypothetical protein